MEKKESVSVQEIENFAKKHRFEVFFSLVFVLASFFSFMLWGLGWSVLLTGLGGILGTCFSAKVKSLLQKSFSYVFRQEETIQIILGIVVLVFSIFLAPLLFFVFGLMAGKGLHRLAMNPNGEMKP
jgi:hypothetical protein